MAITNAVKATEPCVALIFGIFILHNAFSKKAIALMILVILGASMITIEDNTFSVDGVLYAALSNLFLQARNVFVKSLMEISNDSKGPNIFLTCNFVGLIFLFILWTLYFIQEPSFENVNSEICYSYILLGTFFALQHVFSFMVLDYTLTTTQALLNVSKRVCIILIGALILGSSLTALQIVGMIITFTALYFYMKTLNEDKSQMVLEKTSKNSCKFWHSRCLRVMTCLILIIGTLTYSFQPEILERAKGTTNLSIDANYNSNFTFIWAKVQELPRQFPLVLDTPKFKSLQSKQITIYCGTKRCRAKTLEMKLATNDTVRVFPLKTYQLAKDTAAYEWITRYSMMKVLTGPYFEDDLQMVMILSTLWKQGGIVINLDFPSTQNVNTLAEILYNIPKNSCIFDKINQRLVACNAIAKNVCINKILEKVVDEYNELLIKTLGRESHIEGKWPFKVNFFSHVNHQYNLPENDCPRYLEYIHDSNENTPTVRIEKKKFGLLQYEDPWYNSNVGDGLHWNVGDNMQSFGDLQLLPRVDFFVNREFVNLPTHLSVGENITLILNAYWVHRAILYHPVPYIHPVLTGVHLGYPNSTTVSLLKKNLDFFKENGPVGARDEFAYQTFKSLGIPTVFSGCMTLFIKNFYETEPRSDKIMVVDIPKYLEEVLKQTHIDNLVKLTHQQNRTSQIRMFAIAHRNLELYRVAKVVVTGRLHVAIPCVAIGTPVILYAGREMDGDGRFSGLIDLVHHIDDQRFPSKTDKINYLKSFDWKNPPPNPNQQLLKTFIQNAWSILKKVKEFEDVASMFGIEPHINR